jgi:hypothetical protein
MDLLNNRVYFSGYRSCIIPSLFSFPKEKRILGGYGVHVIFATLSLSIVAVYLASRLLSKPGDEYELKQFDTGDD